MQVSVTFRHMDATDALKSFAADKVSRIEKYMHSPTDAHVVLSVERGHLHRAEINLTANGVRIRGQELDLQASNLPVTKPKSHRKGPKA